MNNLNALYRDIIMEHAERLYDDAIERHPDSITVYNRSCGDSVCILKQNSSIKCTPRGCAICRASASMMSDLVQSGFDRQSIGQIKQIITAGTVPPQLQNDDIAAMAGVAQFPNRVKCALLPWEALEKVSDDEK